MTLQSPDGLWVNSTPSQFHLSPHSTPMGATTSAALPNDAACEGQGGGAAWTCMVSNFGEKRTWVKEGASEGRFTTLHQDSRTRINRFYPNVWQVE